MWPFNEIDRLEQTESLDRLIGVIEPVVRRVLPGQRARDLLHGVWLGHPLHPALVQVPVGAWVSAAVLDATPASRPWATRLIGVGLVGAVPAVAAGWTDWAEQDTAQKRVGLTHAIGNASAIACYAASLLARRRGRHTVGRVLAYSGLGAAAGASVLGGHLAYRQAAGPSHAYPAGEITPSGWQDIGALDELPDGSATNRTVGETPVFVLRTGSRVHALVDRCSHASGPLHEGELVEIRGERCVVCPWHGSTFRIRDGSVVHGPSTAPAPAFDVRVAGGRVQVSLPGLAMGS